MEEYIEVLIEKIEETRSEYLKNFGKEPDYFIIGKKFYQALKLFYFKKEYKEVVPETICGITFIVDPFEDERITMISKDGEQHIDFYCMCVLNYWRNRADGLQ